MNRKDASEKTRNVFCFRIPREMVYQIDSLVMQGRYVSRGEFIRRAIATLLEREMMNEFRRSRARTRTSIINVDSCRS